MTGHQLHAARKRLRLTQSRLADKLGIHRVTIARYESGAGETPIPQYIALAIETLTRRANGRRPRENNC